MTSAHTIRVRVGQRDVEVPAHATVGEILADAGLLSEAVVAATLNNHMVGLATPVDGNAQLQPLLRSDPLGAAAVQRCVAHMLIAVCARRFTGLHLSVGQSLLGGYFYEVDGDAPPSLEELARDLTADLTQMAAADLPFEHRSVPVEAAQEILTDPRGNKQRLLATWPAPLVPVVSLDGFTDITHGPYPPSTRFAAGATVEAYPPGLLLHFGARPAASADHGRQLWRTYRETRDWNRHVGVAGVGDLNHAILADRVEEIIRIAEAQHEKKIAAIADAITDRHQPIRVICIAGPSSAGKTTFVRRLSVQLRVNGIEPVMVSLDDYYRPREEYPLDEHGKRDFEALESLNVEQIDRQLAALLTGEEVDIPRFDFVSGRPLPRESWRPLQLRAHQVLLLEGIHGLNPRVTSAVPPAARFRIYINALTQLVIDDHNRLFTADTRLLRRIVRDRRYRGTLASETIARWPQVRRGEERHIFSFESEADAVFNSALVYESAVLRTFAWRYLLEVPRADPSRVDAYRLLKLLELFVPVFPDSVPANSVLREFIGGSGFRY